MVEIGGDPCLENIASLLNRLVNERVKRLALLW
jgi:hypothetical protein